MKRAYIYILILLIAISCQSIKEDRSGAPCILNLDIANQDESISSIDIWLFNNSKDIILHKRVESDNIEKSISLISERGSIELLVWANLDIDRIRSKESYYGEIVIGEEGLNPIYLYAGTIELNNEINNKKVTLTPAYTSLNISFFTLLNDDNMKFRLYGDCCGYHISSDLIEREFVLTFTDPILMKEEEFTSFNINISKQINYSNLYIQIDEHRIFIGNYILQAASLKRPVNIFIDYANMNLLIEIEDWRVNIPIEITI